MKRKPKGIARPKPALGVGTHVKIANGMYAGMTGKIREVIAPAAHMPLPRYDVDAERGLVSSRGRWYFEEELEIIVEQAEAKEQVV